jgi:BTB/POZ domain-containing protein KCTD9
MKRINKYIVRINNFFNNILVVNSNLIFAISVVVFLAFLTIWFDKNTSLKSSPHDIASLLFLNAESISITTLAILYLKEIPDRKAQKHYEAWQVIDNAAAANVSTSYARKKALEDLSKDGIPLNSLNVPGADLTGIILSDADLSDANLSDVNLRNADLSGANLKNADLSGANLSGANLRNADLSGANLKNADLIYTKLIYTKLGNADLRNANLVGTNLRNADLSGAKLIDAKLIDADLSDTNLSDTNLSGADLSGANLTAISKFLPEQIKLSKNWGSATYHNKRLDDPEVSKHLGLY